MNLRLEISVAARPVAIFEHDGPALNIGRDPACELALDPAFEGVSWRHARIDVTPTGVVLCDLGSTNGTYVNDKRIATPTVLHTGDAIGLGMRGPRLRLASTEPSIPTATVPDPQTADESGLSPSGRTPIKAGVNDRALPTRPLGPVQPESDPRPTLAGALPLHYQKLLRPPFKVRMKAAWQQRRWAIIGVGLLGLAVAAALVLLLSGVFQQ
ncbi:MAG TPA: FHA domain-containing protein [Gemmataceae bacterium]|nr:FHA domain-containing protein [Gemmataceae bacterium]